jgi:2-polyprenyl-3-methyl-5-hydroxy-6-metoxy-1,4-benzoquinol methylase
MAASPDVEARARLSRGGSDEPIYTMIEAALRQRGVGGTLADIGCGEGRLWARLSSLFARCIGVDVVRYDGLPRDIEFRPCNLDAARLPIEPGSVDCVVAAETIEHLENPRAFVRMLVEAVRAGGWLVVTTPNQLSLLSKLTLVTKNQFNAFQDASYPAHLTALVEQDLIRIARECGLDEIAIAYSGHSRLPLTPWPYPRIFAVMSPRAFSDNVLLIARKGTGRAE